MFGFEIVRQHANAVGFTTDTAPDAVSFTYTFPAVAEKFAAEKLIGVDDVPMFPLAEYNTSVVSPLIVPNDPVVVIELFAPNSTVVAVIVPLLNPSCPLAPEAFNTTVPAVIDDTGDDANEIVAAGDPGAAVSFST